MASLWERCDEQFRYECAMHNGDDGKGETYHVMTGIAAQMNCLTQVDVSDVRCDELQLWRPPHRMSCRDDASMCDMNVRLRPARTDMFA